MTYDLPFDRSLLDRHPSTQAITGERWACALTESCVARFADGAQVSGTDGGCDRYFSIVLSGALRIRANSRDGRSLGIHRVPAGDLCTVTVLSLYQASAPVDVVAEGATTLLRVPTRHFSALLEEPPFRTFVMRALTGNVAALLLRAGETSFEGLRERILRRVDQARRNGEACIAVSHKELADELGSTREAISRVLKELEKQGMLTLGRRAIMPGPAKS
ncbi:Crp/Fnr family transcriptional regulator [Lysobacter xanthus]